MRNDNDRRTNRYYRYRKKLELLQLLGGKCVDCGFSGHVAALDFDHIDPKTKSFVIGTHLLKPMKILVAEVQKCEVRCANCHRIKSAVHTLDDQKFEFLRRYHERICKGCGVSFSPVSFGKFTGKALLAKFCSSVCSTDYAHSLPKYKEKDRRRGVSRYWAARFLGRPARHVTLSDIQRWIEAGSPKIIRDQGACAICGFVGPMKPRQKYCESCGDESEKKQSRLRYEIGRAIGKSWKHPFANTTEMVAYSLLAS